MPAPLVFVLATVPVSMRVAVTSTSGTTRPLGSFITPLSVAVSVCPNAGTPAKTHSSRTANNDLIRRAVSIISPLPLYAQENSAFVPAYSLKELLGPYSEELSWHCVPQGWFGGVPKYASSTGFPVGAVARHPAGSRVTKTVSISSRTLGSSNFIAQR